MASLSNYLRTHRKRLTLSQEEVGFLLGVNGMDKAIKVSREENSAREPTLQYALAYEAVYGTPVRELFAGLYKQAEQKVAERAKLLAHYKTSKAKPKRQEILARLVSKLAD